MSQILPQIDGYKIISKLGQGGMGTVFYGERLSDNREVAIKVMRADLGNKANFKDFLSRFRREIKISSSFAHPYVTTTLDGGVTNEGILFLVLEFIEGTALDELVLVKPLAEDECTQMARHLAEALSYIHSHGIFHRDIKPGNIIIVSKERSVLVDFGLALADDYTRITGTRDIVGTFRFMAPEQISGQGISKASDLFSLGVVLHFSLTGQLPFDQDALYEMAAGLTPEPPTKLRELNPKISRKLSKVIHKSLAIKAEERYQKAEEFLAALDDTSPSTTVEVRPVEKPLTPVVKEAKSDSSRRTIFALAISALLGLVLIFTQLFPWSPRKKMKPSEVSNLRALMISQRALPEEIELMELGQGLIDVGKLKAEDDVSLAALAMHNVLLHSLTKKNKERSAILAQLFIERYGKEWCAANRLLPIEDINDAAVVSGLGQALVLTSLEILKDTPFAVKLKILPLLEQFLRALERAQSYKDSFREVEELSKAVQKTCTPLLSKVGNEEESFIVANCLFAALFYDFSKEGREKVLFIVDTLLAREGLVSQPERLKCLAAFSLFRNAPDGSTKHAYDYTEQVKAFIEAGLPKLSSQSDRAECAILLAMILNSEGRYEEALKTLQENKPTPHDDKALKRRHHYRRALILIEDGKLDRAMAACQEALRFADSEAKRQTIKSEIIRIKTLKLINR